MTDINLSIFDVIDMTRTSTHRQWCVRISGEMHERDNLCDCGKTIADLLVAHIDRLTNIVKMFGTEYDVDGRMEWHSYNCIYRKTWAMDGMTDEPQCIAVRFALFGHA